MKHVLDRPIWSALDSAHAAFVEGDDRARRYEASISPFAASMDDRPESLASLARLVSSGPMVLLQADPICLPDGLKPSKTAEAVQMLAVKPTEPVSDARIERLRQADAAHMIDLARLTNPGPFTSRALELGSFWGIRSGGELIAMAGERLRQPGFTEVSGVCTHPDARGQGLARLLSLHVAAGIRRRGDVPYLHAYATNVAAIRLYKTIGFEIRSTMHVATAGPRD